MGAGPLKTDVKYDETIDMRLVESLKTGLRASFRIAASRQDRNP